MWASNGSEWIQLINSSMTTEGSGTFSAGGIDGDQSHVIHTKPNIFTLLQATIEKELICSTSFRDFFSLTANLNATFSQAGLSSGTVSMDFSITRIPARTSPPSSTPEKEFRAGSTFSFGFPPAPAFRRLEMSKDGTGDQEGQIKINGRSFPVTFVTQDFGGDSSSYPSAPLNRPFAYTFQKTDTFSLVIEPAEYWPYDPEDGGGPIYDSATGQQLRPFPN
jgi:hypothetical protein